MFVQGKSRIIFFPSNTLIYGISRDGSENFNMRTCEHMILGQLSMGARQTKNAPLSPWLANSAEGQLQGEETSSSGMSVAGQAPALQLQPQSEGG